MNDTIDEFNLKIQLYHTFPELIDLEVKKTVHPLQFGNNSLDKLIKVMHGKLELSGENPGAGFFGQNDNNIFIIFDMYYRNVSDENRIYVDNIMSNKSIYSDESITQALEIISNKPNADQMYKYPLWYLGLKTPLYIPQEVPIKN